MGFQVPNDLLGCNLSLTQAQDIIIDRQRRKVLQNRIDDLPRRKTKLEGEIRELDDAEARILDGAAPVAETEETE